MRAIISRLRYLQKTPAMIRSFFQHLRLATLHARSLQYMYGLVNIECTCRIPSQDVSLLAG